MQQRSYVRGAQKQNADHEDRRFCIWWWSSPLEETSLPHGHCHRRRNCNPWALPRGMRRPPLISPHPWVLKRTASTALARGRWPVFVRVDSQRAASPPRISVERHQKSANLKILHYATHICSRLATTMTSSADEGEILTLKQVADFLKVTERTIYRLAAAGKIPAFKVGGTWRFSRAEINRWIQRQQIDGKADKT